MSLESNKELVRRQYEELLNKKNLTVIDTDMSEDFVDHEAMPGSPNGREGVRQWMKYLYSMVPDLKATIEDMVVEENKVATRMTWRGTHNNLFMGMSPTGKVFGFKGMVFWRIENGQIIERWASLDMDGLKKQLEGK